MIRRLKLEFSRQEIKY